MKCKNKIFNGIYFAIARKPRTHNSKIYEKTETKTNDKHIIESTTIGQIPTTLRQYVERQSDNPAAESL